MVQGLEHIGLGLRFVVLLDDSLDPFLPPQRSN